jgi:hypothetical protein
MAAALGPQQLPTLPVLFTMLAGHFVHLHARAWAVLVLMARRSATYFNRGMRQTLWWIPAVQ